MNSDPFEKKLREYRGVAPDPRLRQRIEAALVDESQSPGESSGRWIRLRFAAAALLCVGALAVRMYLRPPSGPSASPVSSAPDDRLDAPSAMPETEAERTVARVYDAFDANACSATVQSFYKTLDNGGLKNGSLSFQDEKALATLIRETDVSAISLMTHWMRTQPLHPMSGRLQRLFFADVEFDTLEQLVRIACAPDRPTRGYAIRKLGEHKNPVCLLVLRALAADLHDPEQPTAIRSLLAQADTGALPLLHAVLENADATEDARAMAKKAIDALRPVETVEENEE